MTARSNEGSSALPLWRALRISMPLLMGLTALLVLGCALTSKSEPILPRYFSPERSGAIEDKKLASDASGLAGELRVGRIRSASYLDERMVFRDSAFELGYYQEKRWTEAPEEYLRRRLERALFQERGLRHVIGGFAPTLEVELTAFEEIRKPKRIARVQVSVRLQDARLVRWEETLTVDQPVPTSSDPELANGMVEAVGLALGAVVNQIADRVAKELAAPPAAAVENPANASSRAPPPGHPAGSVSRRLEGAISPPRTPRSRPP